MLLASGSWTAVAAIATVVIAAIAAGVAIWSVIVALQGLRETAQQHRDAIWAEIVMSRIDQYGRQEMLEDILCLHRFAEKHCPDFAKTFVTRKEDNQTEDKKDGEIEKVDNARRRVKHYFLSIGYLVHKGVISHDDVRTFHTIVSLNTLLDVIEKMEKESERQTGRTYEKEVFAVFRKIRCELEA